jgi:DNA-directed RNA polymerase subunit RPC12/RpoP
MNVCPECGMGPRGIDNDGERSMCQNCGHSDPVETIRKTCAGCGAETPWDLTETLRDGLVYECALCGNHRVDPGEVEQ